MDVSFESRTYLPAHGTESHGADPGNTHVLLYEYLSLDVQDPAATSGFYLRAGGWGRADLADETFGRDTNSELQYAFLGWRAPRLNAEARLGRVSLTSGVARNEVFDGALLGSDLPLGFDVTLFGGIPVETDDDDRSSDTLYGARLSQGRAGLYRIGASYLKEKDDEIALREEAGVDVDFTPHLLVELSGNSLYNVTDDAWARHDYRLVVGPFAKRVKLSARWSQTDYQHYFTDQVNVVFAIAPTTEEKLDAIGGGLEIALGRGFTLFGEYTSYSYDVAESAQAFGGSLEWAGSGFTAGAGYRQMDGSVDEDRYQQYRANVAKSFGALNVALGGEYVAYEVEINGEKNATTGRLTLGYALSKSLEVSASAEYGVTPEYEREVNALLAAVWRYDVETKKGGAK
jgi:hypothetical protein